MLLRLLIIISLCLSLPHEDAETWMPCMPFCDTMCTGVAAISLTANVAAQYSSLSSQLLSNGQSIARLSSSFIDQQANLYGEEYEASQNRVRAYDGLAKVVTLTLEAGAAINERITDHIAQEILNIKKTEKVAAVVYRNGLHDFAFNLPFENNMLSAIPQLSKEIEVHKTRYKEASKYQLEMTKKISMDSEGIQLPVLLGDIDFEISNPFTLDEIEEEYWEEYQKFITLVFNNSSKSSDNSLIKRQVGLQKQLALHVLSKSLSEMVKIPEDRADELLSLTGEGTTTIKAALFEQYKQEMMNVNTQTVTKSSPVEALLVINNLQLAQKNLLLKEIRDTKKLKNALLSINTM